MNKPIICLDFDGVLHSYERGWQNGEIYGTCSMGFFTWALGAAEKFTLVVYSSRSKTKQGIADMRYFLIKEFRKYAALVKSEFSVLNDGPELRLCLSSGAKIPLTFAHEKPPAWVTIDDRCIPFWGSFQDQALDVDKLLAFEPWNSPKRLRKNAKPDDAERFKSQYPIMHAEDGRTIARMLQDRGFGDSANFVHWVYAPDDPLIEF